MRFFVLGATALPWVLALPTNNPLDLSVVKAVEKRQHIAPKDRAQAVVDTFKLSWDGYYAFAFPNDELKPVTNGFSNSR
jgi:mannosyl-oligosaccharide alpha-1,2-mannosidase